MNCYDFDKTIYRKDCSIKFFFYCLKKKPLLVFHLFKCFFVALGYYLGWTSLKTFKQIFFRYLKKIKNIEDKINLFWQKEIKHINQWYLEQKSEADVICSASPEFLVKPALSMINPTAVVISTQMDIKTGTIEGENIQGQNKVDAIRKHFNGEIIFENVYSDSESDLPMLSLARNKFIVGKGGKPYPYGTQKVSLLKKIKSIFKVMRPKHYLKNLLIFLPLFFSGLLRNSTKIVDACCGFIAFCLVASCVYVMNDLLDAKNDRRHSVKCTRPVACYMLKSYEAIILTFLLLFSGFAVMILNFGWNPWLICLLVCYVVINLAYSLILKNIVVIDVFIVASCYMLRILFGGVIVGVAVSKWLYLTVLCGALFIAFGKRLNEIKNETNQTRKVIGLYDANFLDKNLYLSLAMCLVFYSLWATNIGSSLSRFNQLILLLTIPLVYFIMIKYSYNIEKNSKPQDPVEVFFCDYILVLAAVIFVALIVIAFYTSFNLSW